jgi:hypothetical protein
VTKNGRETLLTIAYLVMGLGGTMLAGYLTYGSRFTHAPRPLLLLFTVGLGGTLIYTALRLRGYGYAILMVVLMYLGQLALLFRPPLRPHYFVDAAFFAVPVGAAFIVSSALYRRFERLKFGRFVLMGLIVGFAYLIMIAAFLIREHGPLRVGILWAQTFIGMKMGAGIGLGLELVEFFSAPTKAQAEDLPPPPPRY